MKMLSWRLLASMVFFLMSQSTFSASSPLIAGRVLAHPRTVQSFELKDTHHQQYGVAQLKGHWTLMYFGFTRCQGKCPVSFTALKGLYATLKNEKWADEQMPQVVFVSVDPYRDTIADINGFVHKYDASFLGLSGDLSHVLALSDQLDVSFHVINPGSEDYSITHTGEIAAINPEGQVVAFFSYPQHAETLSKDYQSVVNRVSGVAS